MLILGLLLIIAAALVTVGAIYDAGETATVEILGQTITTTAAGVFVAGLATMLIFLLGVWAIYASFGRSRRKRAERKAARREQRESVARLEEEQAALREENERLARELRERQQRPASGSDTPPMASGAAGGGAAGAAAAHDDPQQGHSHDAGGRSIMDRITGRHPENEAGHDHRHDQAHDPLETQRMATPVDGRADDRVIDDRTGRTDVGASNAADPHGTGRHRDST